MVKSKLTIGLFWHSFRSSNLGVSALTDANMSLISNAAFGIPVEFIIFGPKNLGDFDTPNEFSNVREVTVSSIINIKEIFVNIRACDLVYDIGSGDSFADIYGWKRLTKTAGLKVISALAGRRPVLSPQTIGPFQSFLSRFIAYVALRSCDVVFARDQFSFDRAKALMGSSASSRLARASDVAFELKGLVDWPEKFPSLDKGKQKVGINVSGLLYNGGYKRNNQFGLSSDYKALMRKVLGQLAASGNIEAWLIPHVFHVDRVALECDRAASLELQKIFPNLKIAPIFRNAREAKTFIGAMDLMLAARMHAAIAAVSSGVACIPMSYSVKFQGLFESIEYPFTMDLKTITQQEAEVQITEALGVTAVMAKQALASRELALDALEVYRNYLSEVMVPLSQKS